MNDDQEVTMALSLSFNGSLYLSSWPISSPIRVAIHNYLSAIDVAMITSTCRVAAIAMQLYWNPQIIQ
jgi:hypothetical protein